MIIRFVALLTLISPAYSQIGGGAELTYQMDGIVQNDKVGYAVSDAGDVNADGFQDFIVGAPGTTNFAIGTVTVYSGLDGTTLYEWSGLDHAGDFGASVSGGGDLNADGFDDILIGSQFASPNGLDRAGSAFAYSGADGSLLYRWNGVASFDRFGGSIAMAGDVNQDGFEDVVIGAYQFDPGGLHDAGSAFVYSGATGLVLFQWSGQIRDEWFAEAVSGAGDVNQDGFDDIIIGTKQGDPFGLDNAGIVTLYSGFDGSLLFQWNGQFLLDGFGASVSKAGDLNQDGFGDVLIGAPFTNHGFALNFGTAYAYSGADGSLLFQWESFREGGFFGWSVSSITDTDHDGVSEILIGAPFSNTSMGYSAGSAYLFSGRSGAPLLEWSGATADSRLGYSVSGSRVNLGAGNPLIILGAPSAGLHSEGSASVYIYSPFLQADAISISASTGGTVQLDLDFPEAAAFDEYKVLISATGLGPSTYGVAIPLSRDNLVDHTFLGNYPMPVSNMHGVLDAAGNAAASFTAPAGFNPQLVGRTFYLAAIANQPGQLPEYSSVAVAIEITP